MDIPVEELSELLDDFQTYCEEKNNRLPDIRDYDIVKEKILVEKSK